MTISVYDVLNSMTVSIIILKIIIIQQLECFLINEFFQINNFYVMLMLKL